MPATFDWRRLGDRALRLLLSTVFIVAGGMKLAAVEFEVSNFERFGYANWFMYAVGIAQLLGAASLWVRRYVAYGALFLAAMMAAGAVSHLRTGDPAVMAAPALVLLALLCGLAFTRRGELSTA
ncbi:DoxX family protein [Methylobacterium brachiatum]|jgi:putative oxidoreductase|uniref:DoxX family protein n=1 Tax=Methylobacterium brachiatum TaxID=269660 RepID=A0AAJ1TWQ8_9HYPH|nr:DoxX family protein [Methylobacterium brachiatum]MCB4804219.1 DoxX family protein [Methylobacterium brachiatum]MDH2310856.1 DoxX family protein [Methylobacterium brachiatum]MDQ0545228.1 putative membrane protein YphA (DoxX/SURF4 family) [Methylobacterium brachiatum]SFI50313.1 DoxX-like family protein [Methylobacterium brachiatum]